MTRGIQGVRILIVEDETLTALSLEHHLAAEGASVVGLAATVDKAMSVLSSEVSIDVAYLDMKLRGASAAPVGDALLQRRVPFVIVTATPDAVPDRLQSQRIVTKPVSLEHIADVLASVVAIGGR